MAKKQNEEAWRNRIVGYGEEEAGQIVANPLNWRIHPKNQQEGLGGVLDTVGIVQNILISRNSGFLIDGHLRVTLAMRKNEHMKLPVTYVDLSEEEEAMILATLDPIGAMAVTDKDNLETVLRMAQTDNEEMQKLLEDIAKTNKVDILDGEQKDDPGAQIDRAEELRVEWGVELGQLWRIPSVSVPGGEHRIICGDCTERDVVEKVMEGKEAEILFTSPPYADMREYSKNDLSIERLIQIFPVWKRFCRYFIVNLGIQFKNGEVYEYWNKWIESARADGLKMLSWNVWDRINATSVSSQMKMFAITHEWVFVFGQEEKKLNRTWEKSEESKKRELYYRANSNGQKVTSRRQADGSVRDSVIGEIYDNKNMGTVYTGYAEMERSIDHPAKFPVDFPAGYIGAMTNERDLVADPFLGSGTTLVACERMGRLGRGIEISPAYVAVSLQRLADMGLEPHLA